MKVVIPAAGQGTRLRPHTHTIPKVLLPVAGKPIIGHILSDVAGLDPEEVRLVVGYRGETLAAYAREEFPELPIRIVWQQEQLGLGHAVLQALDEGDRGAALVVLGDTVFDVDYAAVVAREENVLGVRPVPDPERFGIVELDEGGERIARLVEKPAEPRGNLALVGLYFVHEAEALRAAIQGLVEDDQRTRGEYQLTDALQRMIDAGLPFVPYRIGDWFDCGKPETLLDTNRQLLERRAPASSPEARVERSTIVEPVFLDRGCTIENSVVGPYVSLARGASVRDTVVRDSIIARGAVLEGVFLERSIIGPDVRAIGRAHVLNLGDGSEWTQ